MWRIGLILAVLVVLATQGWANSAKKDAGEQSKPDPAAEELAVDCGRCDETPNLSICDFVGDVCNESEFIDESVGYHARDYDGNGSGPDVADLIYLVDYMYNSGQPPANRFSRESASKSGLDVTDLVELVEQLFVLSQPEAEDRRKSAL
jgi:hypothetical protein